jgi:gluconokinase
MGVSGSGKSTIADHLARRLGWRYEDGDRFHPASNVAKMSAGHPLTDEDRWPWLQAIADEIDRLAAAGERAVIACSALKRAYRDILVHGRDDVRIVFLDGTQDLIAARPRRTQGALHAAGPARQPVQDAGAAGSERTADHCIDRCAGRENRGRHRHSIEPGSPMTRIALVVSDVDGTLLTKDKVLTDGAKAAVQKLHDGRHRLHHRLQPADHRAWAF